MISLKMSTKDLQTVQVNAYHASVSSLSLKIYAQLILFIFAMKYELLEFYLYRKDISLYDNK